MFWKKQDNHMKALAELLANGENREGLLGVRPANLPTPDQIREQAAKLARYSDSKDYLKFAEEAWGRILNHLDVIMDDRSSDAKVQFHRGALKESLDLLRVSYTARHIVEQDAVQSESLPHE